MSQAVLRGEDITERMHDEILAVRNSLNQLMTGSLSDTDVNFLLEIKRIQEVARNAFSYEERVIKEYRYATWFHLVDHVDVMTFFDYLIKNPSKSNVAALLKKLSNHVDYHDVLFVNHYNGIMLRRA